MRKIEKEFYEKLEKLNLDDLQVANGKLIYQYFHDKYGASVPEVYDDHEPEKMAQCLVMEWRDSDTLFVVEVNSDMDWFWFIFDSDYHTIKEGFGATMKKAFKEWTDGSLPTSKTSP